MKTIASIGSAGKNTDKNFMTRELYDAMCEKTLLFARENEARRGVSGGAAFADHTVVKLYLNGDLDMLTLYLPAEFKNGRFAAKGRHDAPGDRANQLHDIFRHKTGVDGLKEIEAAIKKGAEIKVFNGFKRRNLEVANDCNVMIAHTFGHKPESTFLPSDEGFSSHEEAGLKDGGTAHTWGECWKASAKRHVNLRDLYDLIHTGQNLKI